MHFSYAPYSHLYLTLPPHYCSRWQDHPLLLALGIHTKSPGRQRNRSVGHKSCEANRLKCQIYQQICNKNICSRLHCMSDWIKMTSFELFSWNAIPHCSSLNNHRAAMLLHKHVEITNFNLKLYIKKCFFKLIFTLQK